MRINVYVDGFNFYYGVAAGQPYKWLDFRAFAQSMLQSGDIVGQILYCTAEVTADEAAQERQRTYLRALRTLPDLRICFGQFVTHERWARPVLGGKRINVVDRQEKGSDVNLASYLVRDAAKGEFEAALVISNDSDLVTPIRMVTEEFNLPVGVAMPLFNERAGGIPREPSVELLEVATFVRTIKDDRTWRRRLRRSQFADVVTDAEGMFTKPAKWSSPPY